MLESPPIIELVGPAGVGKTALSTALSQRDEGILEGADLELRRLEQVPAFVSNAAYLLPVLLRRSPSSRWFTWDEIKAMVYLRGWPSVLRQQASNNTRAIILDHGPVFKLAKLLAFGPERLKGEGYTKWWNATFKQWAFALDIIVWLDASDTSLIERINARSQRHAVKGRSEREATIFLARYRTSYEQILAKLTAYDRPRLLHFDTSDVPIDKAADEILNACIYSYQ